MIGIPDQQLMKQYNVRVVMEMTIIHSQFGKITDLIKRGVLKVNLADTFPLDQTKETLEQTGTGKNFIVDEKLIHLIS